MRRSDLTDAPISGDEPTSVRIQFGDGRARELSITAAEAADLAKKGVDVSHRRDRAVAWIRGRPLKWFLWGAGLFLTSLLIPAATKQWSDRSQELDVKNALIGEISRGASDAWLKAATVVRAPKSPANARDRQKALDSWVAAESTIDPTINLYFDEQRVDTSWGSFRDAMYDYVALACCDPKRTADRNAVRKYLDAHPFDEPGEPPVEGRDPWEILSAEPRKGETAYRETYMWVGLQLLRERVALLEDLNSSDARGFSSGWRDFMHDAVAPLSRG